MSRALFALGVLAACGRISFDPRSDTSGDARGDGSEGDAVDALNSDPSLLLWFTFEPGDVLANSGTGNDATCASCGIATPGPRAGQQALLLNGNDTCLYVDVPLNLRPATEVTFAAWQRIDAVASQTAFSAPFNSDSGVADTLEIYSNGNVDEMRVELDFQYTVVLTTPTGEWHHVAATYANGVFRGYLDGVLVGTDATATAPLYTQEPMMIGCDRDNGAETGTFEGALDEIRLYSRALSDAELAVLAQ